jgi:hypothetical protein
LPEALAIAVMSPNNHGEVRGMEELIRLLSLTEAVPEGFAYEHATVVCEAIAAMISEEVRIRLRAELPFEIGQLIVEPAVRRSYHHPHDQDRRTLSTGRPGGLHPLSDAGPPGELHNLAAGRPGGQRPLSTADG